MDPLRLAYYNEKAEGVSLRYEAAVGGVASVFPFVFVRGETVLEIDAVGPSPALRTQALVVHPELAVRL